MYYLGMFNGQPILHTMSKHYADTSNAMDTYMENYLEYYFENMPNHLGIFQGDKEVLTVNDETLKDYLKKYSMADLIANPDKYTKKYYQSEINEMKRNHDNEINEIETKYEQDHPHKHIIINSDTTGDELWHNHGYLITVGIIILLSILLGIYDVFYNGFKLNNVTNIVKLSIGCTAFAILWINGIGVYIRYFEIRTKMITRRNNLIKPIKIK